MQELLVDFITSLDGYASAEGWPGWWGLEGPEYLRWLEEQPERDYTQLMGAKTYRLMSGFATEPPAGAGAEEADSMAELTSASKVVFSSSLQAPLSWANTELVRGDAVQAVREMKRTGTSPMATIGSLSLCRSLLQSGLVDRFRVERIYDGYPDVGLDMLNSRTFDGRIQLLEYAPRVLDGPPGTNAGA